MASSYVRSDAERNAAPRTSPIAAASPALPARASTAARVLALQRLAGNRAVQRAVLRSLRDFRYHMPSNKEIAQTREYKAYMNPALIWQTKWHATPREAEVACRVMLDHISRGEQVRWDALARECLLNAREQLNPTPQPRTTHHYRIEQKAWIPHAHVTDPAGILGSSYRGDNHIGYEGPWRVLNWVEFDYDGQAISKFTGGDNYGVSYRDAWWGTEVGHATGTTGRDMNTAGYFTMWISSKVPIPWVPAPEINSNVEVIVTCNELSLVYTTDEFPSHGIQVSQDGKVVDTKVVFDASTVDGDDPLEIAYGLTEFENKGSVDVTFPPGLWPCEPD